MAKYSSILAAIGRTPLVRLNRIGKDVPSQIWVKVECTNPGGSVKDRVAIAMVEAAEREGTLKPGGTIIEATAGNTGVGLAMTAAMKGYRMIFVLPDKMSEEKVNLLKAYGAEVVITPTSVPPDSPESYNGVADRLARDIKGGYRPNQFANPENPGAHYRTTGPEIWEDTDGAVDVFVAGMGTGGTISGTGRYLKERKPSVNVVGADPEGSILSGGTPRSYKVEGIGEDFIPRTFTRQVVDEMVRVSDRESFNTARRLAREEGILAGGSSGTALAAALTYARRLPSPQMIVALLPDTGRNYLSKIFSDRWMQENGFWEQGGGRRSSVGDVLDAKGEMPAILALSPRDTLQHAIGTMRTHGVSQLPVIDVNAVTGSINEAAIMKALHDGVDFAVQEVGGIMGAPLPSLDAEVDVAEAYRVLLSGASALLVTRRGSVAGIISRTDLIHHLVTRDDRNDTYEI